MRNSSGLPRQKRRGGKSNQIPRVPQVGFIRFVDFWQEKTNLKGRLRVIAMLAAP